MNSHGLNSFVLRYCSVCVCVEGTLPPTYTAPHHRLPPQACSEPPPTIYRLLAFRGGFSSAVSGRSSVYFPLMLIHICGK